MTKEEMKNKCTERAKIFQQAMKSCHSSNPIDCIEWFADRIADLEKENAELKKKVENLQKYLDTRNCYRECAETWLKLTEAKKLLKQFLEAKNGEDTYKAEWEAEQFLKDNKVEKC